MKHMRWALGFIALALLCGVGYVNQSLAETLTLYDTGSPNGTQGDMTLGFGFPSQINNTANCQSIDTCPSTSSQPQVDSITVTWDNATGKLLTVTITSIGNFPQHGDSLYINTHYTGNLESWDYYVKSGAEYPAGQNFPTNGVYEIKGSPDFAGDIGYIHTPEGAVAAGTDGRTGHANGIDSSYLATPSLADVISRGTPDANTMVVPSAVVRPGTNIFDLTYDFQSLGVDIILGDQFVIGYTPWCANDVALVLGQRDSGGAAIPEPATMVLFGMGLAGLAGWRARRRSAATKQA